MIPCNAAYPFETADGSLVQTQFPQTESTLGERRPLQIGSRSFVLVIGIDDRLVDTFEFENSLEYFDALLVANRRIILHRQILAVDVQGLRDLDDRCSRKKRRSVR